MEKKTTRVRTSRYHNFRDKDGNPLTMKQICEMVGLSDKTVRARLKEYESPPSDLPAFLAKEAQRKKDAESTKAKMDALELAIKEEKLRELKFKNELAEDKYVLLSDVQLALDNFLISLKTNLEALPEQVVQSIMVCRDEFEGSEILLEALRHLTRDFAKNPIEIRPAGTES